ncbi:MAG: hypothetical protein DMF82_19540 [Acidobacteria bacterium]|nr:MAG: hypothetical protein DMF82_19540 [Acidobacteriota bacterium]
MKAMKLSLLAGLVLSLAAVAARAQEPAREPSEDEDARPQPPRQIRVLENPYDIASFYRSHQGDYFGYQAPGTSERYPIAGFYRQNGARGYGYSRFWSSGYSGRGRGGLVLTYRRRIGDNGDLYLIVPFLAGIGPLSGAFLGDR